MIEAIALLLKDYWFALTYAVLWFLISIVISWFNYARPDLGDYPDEIDDLSPVTNSETTNTDSPEP